MTDRHLDDYVGQNLSNDVFPIPTDDREYWTKTLGGLIMGEYCLLRYVSRPWLAFVIELPQTKAGPWHAVSSVTETAGVFAVSATYAGVAPASPTELEAVVASLRDSLRSRYASEAPENEGDPSEKRLLYTQRRDGKKLGAKLAWSIGNSPLEVNTSIFSAETRADEMADAVAVRNRLRRKTP